jgi:hypothetical protein
VVNVGYSFKTSFAENEAFRGYEESFGKAESDFPPVKTVISEWASNGLFTLVGQGKQTNSKCGQFAGFTGCMHTELHNHVGLDGVNYAGLVYVHLNFHSCDKPSCPVCFKRGWAVRQAGHVKQRLDEASKRHGLVEHIIAPVPPSDFGLSYEVIHAKVLKALKARGIIGGCLIFHGFRYANFKESERRNVPFGWYWSPHFHCLGFIEKGYTRCRHCKLVEDSSYGKPCEAICKGCSGFEAATREQFKKDGYLAKVLGERITVRGTAYYQLNHACVKVGVERFHVATWFGVCSYRKLKVTYEKEKLLCPICQRECVALRYCGCQHIETEKYSWDFKPNLFLPMNEGHGDVWVEANEGDFG